MPTHLAGLLRASEGTGVGAELPTRSLIFDCLLAGVFFACGSAFLPLFFAQWRPIDAAFVALVCLPLMLRRRLPRISFVLCQVFGLFQVWWPSPIGLHDGALLFSLYSLVGFTNRRTGLYGLAVLLVVAFSGAVNDWWGFVDDQLSKAFSTTPSLLTRVATTAGMIALVFAAWASGERLRSARMGQVALTDRAEQLEREREQQSRIAAAAERARIAREMHDVIAHALSVMIAQADGAAYVIDSSPATAKTALERISGTGRDSLTQMRGLLGLLREGEDDPSRAAVPQPGVEQLPQLVEQAGATGLTVTLEQTGNADKVAEMTGLTIYRLVQESLTNARKHGGDQVRLVIDFGADGTDLRVINSVADTDKRLQTGEPGHGLQGMKERVGAVGGRLTTGPQADGFEVHAWLPHLPATVAPAEPTAGES
ncbi:sensor histidine kinase [Microlunatus soli]|uniref:histidine kinase n=1 Tax=Microlunatus soli TaxID=630515 RepID=A0A1H1Y9H3_9ACTN|nr:histidine kinase [Microlunatus soli]SDT17899.1 Signal transduction histidine kinase [Microlunatus soli]